MKQQKSQQFYLLSILILVLFFQNCTGGFKTLQEGMETGVEVTVSVPEASVDVESKVLYEGSLSELQSITVKFEGDGEISFPQDLPKGAVYDAASRQLHWIPVRGQAGQYQLQVEEAGKAKGHVNLKVFAVTEELLQVSGPPSRYADGDVGFIYVHGAGDVDRCANRDDLSRYWGGGPDMVSPDKVNRMLVCYDSRKAVANVAVGVANQILSAKCGRFNKCVIFTHSMGGLLMEHMFTHTREALPTDPEPSMYNSRALYQAVKERTLFVVSLASAAGGSKAASIVNKDGANSLGQDAVGAISRFMGANDDSTKNLVVSYASRVVAPYTEDPGVPFFMIPGFTEKTAREASGLLGSLFRLTFNRVPLVVFNGDRSLAALDEMTSFASRSDGLVDFRSACGIASDKEEEGPGREAALEDHFRYCWKSKKKPNHYVWFLSNMNHYLITGLNFNCRNNEAPCVALFPNEFTGSFIMDKKATGQQAMEVVRSRLIAPAPVLVRGLASAP